MGRDSGRKRVEGLGFQFGSFAKIDHTVSSMRCVRIEGMAGFMVHTYLKLLEVELSVARRYAALLVAKDGLAAPIANASHLRFKF
jgi:hypothetical protein